MPNSYSSNAQSSFFNQAHPRTPSGWSSELRSVLMAVGTGKSASKNRLNCLWHSQRDWHHYFCRNLKKTDQIITIEEFSLNFIRALQSKSLYVINEFLKKDDLFKLISESPVQTEILLTIFIVGSHLKKEFIKDCIWNSDVETLEACLNSPFAIQINNEILTAIKNKTQAIREDEALEFLNAYDQDEKRLTLSP